MAILRTHVVLSHSLVSEIDRLVGKRRRSAFLAEAASRELLRQRQARAIERATGAWKDIDHPELRRGSALAIRKLRQDNDRRLTRLHGRP